MKGSLTLITGGARSGKSSYAQELAACWGTGADGDVNGSGCKSADKEPSVLVVATAEAHDTELAWRIERHREERPKTWKTVEEPHDVLGVLRENPDYSVVVIDCITMLVSNWLFSSSEVQRLGADPPARAELLALEERVGKLVKRARELGEAAAALDNQVIMVTNEVGLGLIPPNPLSRMYRDVLGRVNRVLAEQAEQVLFMVSGLPWCIKPEPGGGPLPGS